MLLIIEGNICAGKSTFMSELSEWCKLNGKHANFIDEPHEIWSNFRYRDGRDALSTYYSDITNKAREFQFLTLCGRIADLNTKYEPGKINIVERSPQSTIEIFGEMLVEDGYITREQHGVFLDLGNKLIPQFLKTTKIFIDTPVDICYQRSDIRDRGTIDKSYLERLGKTYYTNLKFCNDMECPRTCGRYHKIDGTKKFLFNKSIFE